MYFISPSQWMQGKDHHIKLDLQRGTISHCRQPGTRASGPIRTPILLRLVIQMYACSALNIT